MQNGGFRDGSSSVEPEVRCINSIIIHILLQFECRLMTTSMMMGQAQDKRQVNLFCVCVPICP